MDEGPLRERLRRARAACGEDLGALARRSGVRVSHLRAIEEGRFGDLPPGIYARAAIRAFADACQLDPAAVLAECDAFLPRVNDPIEALARKAGLPPPRPATAAAPALKGGEPSSPWRVFAAVAIDAGVIGLLLAVIVVAAALLGRASIGALRGSPAPFALVGLVIGSGYFLWFGGLCGTTLGGLAARASPQVRDREALILRTIATRAFAAATADARAFVRLGSRLGRYRVTPGAASGSALRPGRALSRLRRLDLSPARWSPVHPSGAAPPPPLPRLRG